MKLPSARLAPKGQNMNSRRCNLRKRFIDNVRPCQGRTISFADLPWVENPRLFTLRPVGARFTFHVPRSTLI